MISRIAEKILSEAVEGGILDQPSHYGNSLPLEENPFVDPSRRLSDYILKKAEMKPVWLEFDIEVRMYLREAQKKIGHAGEVDETRRHGLG